MSSFRLVRRGDFSCQKKLSELVKSRSGLTSVVLLQVPFAVQSHIVNWIDSKATFGSDYTHLCAALLSLHIYTALNAAWFGSEYFRNVQKRALLFA